MSEYCPECRNYAGEDAPPHFACMVQKLERENAELRKAAEWEEFPK